MVHRRMHSVCYHMAAVYGEALLLVLLVLGELLDCSVEELQNPAVRQAANKHLRVQVLQVR